MLLKSKQCVWCTHQEDLRVSALGSQEKTENHRQVHSTEEEENKHSCRDSLCIRWTFSSELPVPSSLHQPSLQHQ